MDALHSYPCPLACRVLSVPVSIRTPDLHQHSFFTHIAKAPTDPLSLCDLCG